MSFTPPPADLLTADEAWVAAEASRDGAEAAAREQLEHLAKRHWSMLRISAFVVIMACLLQIRPDHRVQFRWGPDIPLPESCGSKVWFGIECPGCGLTRGFIHLSRGEFWRAWQLNRVSWLLALALLAQFPYRLWSLRQINRHGAPRSAWPTWIGGSLVAILISNWLLKLFGV